MHANNPTFEAIEIERLTHDGRGVARINGKTVFVADTVPGDIISLKITKQQDKFDEADLIQIQTPSNDRTTPFCELYEQCGGCQLQHMSIDAQRRWKAENFITQLTKAVNSKQCEITPPLCGADQAYRRRARFGLAISKKDKVARLGFREKQSNELIDVAQCPVLTPALNQALQEQRPRLLESASRAYKEITLVEADNGVFTTNSSEDTVINMQPHYEIEGLTLNFPADGFVQVNSQQNKQMVAQAIQWLELDTGKHKVLDLFCGVGNFTLPIAKQAKKVTGIEGLAELVDSATTNAKNNQLNNTEFFKANLFEACEKLPWFREQKYHRVLLDPGRQGAFEISKKLHLLKAEIIVYVSCNASTLIRDVQELEKQGYQLTKAGLIDMFPHTTHTEVMVQLKKSKKPKPKKANIFRF
ncbi:23S rRNA (uracil(1939)-C(5))-methyltransferase RlmD [Thiomicrorhabdus immobilis]|uniref:23S rRNA (Uracil(1939)-C(5))-methyltransferase RlmD n=1 Tax=Thiomicrorhabdus immobilis TaxID=2791037 RepID=A0ABN6CXP3_9GAMM|nr:23S rRNA (uracil(1939)-C(5))-methyltransferase RlmD [Thiomicrorhabdus immobilis]BCN93741.1 23S rRNA (uracil(1939)-C(5))-methyltransferase RlmD [Thiomicrorhabdus immobilis]